MSTIPTSLTEKEFNQYIRPYLTTAKRGFECKIPLFKIFNYILYRWHTGCQWNQIPIEADKEHPEKKKSVTTPFIIISASGARMALWKRYGNIAF